LNSVLKDGGSRAFGREARFENISVAKSMAETFRTCLGPKGMSKMLIDQDGLVWVSDTGSTLFEKIDIEHHAAGIVVEAARGVYKEVGDGTVSTVLLIGRTLAEYERLLNTGTHPSRVITGFERAASRCLCIMRELSVDVKSTDSDVLKKIVRTTMAGNQLVDDELASLVAQSALQVAEKRHGRREIDLSNICLRKKAGAGTTQTQLVHGIAFFKEIADPRMPKTIEDARILVLRGELIRNKRSKSGTEYLLSVDDPTKARNIREEEDRFLDAVAQRIVDIGANVIVVEKGISDRLLHKLSRAGVLAIRRVVIEDIERVAKAVGANVCTVLEDVSSDDLGAARLVEERKIGHEPWTFIEGCTNPRAVTILVRGATEHVIDKTEKILEKTLRTVGAFVRLPRTVFGGGALEAELAFRLRNWSNHLSGREQLAAQSFAAALESIPSCIAENAGLGTMDIMIELRSRHARGESHAGINVFKGTVSNMMADEIFEPYVVKDQVMKSVCEAVRLILRIEDYIASKKADRTEHYQKEREEFQRSGKLDRIKRDYGIE